jgi:5-formyltetrahydrofolate cyclo-ligase
MTPAVEIIARKQALRRIINDQRTQIDTERAESAGRTLAIRLAEGPDYRAARCLGVYLSVAGEISTGPLIARARADGKSLCLPAWLAERREYDWVEFDPNGRIGGGPFGIPQPELLVLPTAKRIDLVVIPGLAFDAQGNRLGHGKGIYDRLLIRPLLRGALKVGWAFDFQMRERIPRTEQDVRLDGVMTETHDYRTPRASERQHEEERSC